LIFEQQAVSGILDKKLGKRSLAYSVIFRLGLLNKAAQKIKKDKYQMACSLSDFCFILYIRA
jgi:hypothetical protein